MTLSSDQIANLVQILTITTPIAMFFSGFIVFSFLKFDSLRTRSFVLVFILSVTDFCYSSSTIINQKPVTGTFLCDFQATLVTFLAISTMLWTVMISAVLEGGALLLGVVVCRPMDRAAAAMATAAVRLLLVFSRVVTGVAGNDAVVSSVVLVIWWGSS